MGNVALQPSPQSAEGRHVPFESTPSSRLTRVRQTTMVSS